MQLTFNMCSIGCDWMGQKRYKSLHGCIFAMKHFFEKSLESLALFHVLCRKKCLRSFKIMQLQRLGVNAQTDTQTHKLIAITLRLRARVNNVQYTITINALKCESLACSAFCSRLSQNIQSSTAYTWNTQPTIGCD